MADYRLERSCSGCYLGQRCYRHLLDNIVAGSTGSVGIVPDDTVEYPVGIVGPVH